MKVLLTGSGGMVGQNVLEHPSMRDFDVIAPRSSSLNLLDFSAVQLFLEEHKPDVVIHAAGKVGGIQANVREPVGFLVDNLDMGRNIVLASRQAGVKRLLNLGSSCMYPRNHSEPLREELVLKGELEPTNEGYALAKVVTARLCDYIVREDASFQYKTLIPCNLYGRFDKFDPSHSHLIPAIIHKIHVARENNDSSVEIWGDGSARREFMYAGDLADAVVHALRAFDALPAYMNVGLGHDYSINEYYQVVAEVMGYRGEFVHDLSKPVGMARKLVSIERQQAWGWSARHDLRSGIEKTYSFYLQEKQQ
ncbi:NAD-dependent epimerase/dehydratase family protein [Mariprofundus ferrooxydans]|uniref:GDP-L-fucose synthase family protein n=1 Tax=Mariprofundus ferrooxydans TaxID=314344 RepID=UPI000476D19C